MAKLSNDLDTLQAALRMFFQTMKRPQNWTEITARAGVTIDRPAGAIIHLLASSDKHYRLQDLASALGIEAPSATRKTQELEKIGYLERVVDPKDGRAVSFRLTASGEKLGKKLKAAHRAILSQALAGWSDTDRQDFVRMFEKFSNDIVTSYSQK
jgi:DNA-binding MarR family transcriptional regulator